MAGLKKNLFVSDVDDMPRLWGHTMTNVNEGSASMRGQRLLYKQKSGYRKIRC